MSRQRITDVPNENVECGGLTVRSTRSGEPTRPGISLATLEPAYPSRRRELEQSGDAPREKGLPREHNGHAATAWTSRCLHLQITPKPARSFANYSDASRQDESSLATIRSRSVIITVGNWLGRSATITAVNNSTENSPATVYVRGADRSGIALSNGRKQTLRAAPSFV